MLGKNGVKALYGICAWRNFVVFARKAAFSVTGNPGL
jgi:hypothetical protein